MFRLTARLAAALRPRRPTPPAPVDQPPRTPDPYVWTLPNPHTARWRRWHRRKDRTTPPLPEEACWQPPALPPPRPWHQTPHDDPVRLYVHQAMHEER
ncbi:hypothetical protein ACH4TV_39670 [Streptomyces sp. NPDC020898]|uniref:hypothetical protein n=1 Tax=Streptomyces sp. NPDC020898 TaxID=3365101 RepID=UPI0037B6FF71